jgi:hypothetical protein
MYVSVIMEITHIFEDYFLASFNIGFRISIQNMPHSSPGWVSNNPNRENFVIPWYIQANASGILWEYSYIKRTFGRFKSFGDPKKNIAVNGKFVPVLN